MAARRLQGRRLAMSARLLMIADGTQKGQSRSRESTTIRGPGVCLFFQKYNDTTRRRICRQKSLRQG